MQEKLLTAWCSARRIDLCGKRFEGVEYIGVVLRVVRRLSTHIKSSSTAQQELKAFHTRIQGEETGGAGGCSFAPQRFISHAKPAALLSRNFRETISYVQKLQRDDEPSQRSIGCNPDLDVGELRLWLVISAVGGLLEILRRANLKTERAELRVLEIQPVLCSVWATLDRYVRSGDGVLCNVAWRNQIVFPMCDSALGLCGGRTMAMLGGQVCCCAGYSLLVCSS